MGAASETLAQIRGILRRIRNLIALRVTCTLFSCMANTNQPLGIAAAERLSVGVEVVLFTIRDDALHVLLAPIEAAWRLPGDLVRVDEPVDTAARRALSTVAGASDVWLE